jgi:hypothetical protein
MSAKHFFAHNLAAAFLAGPWTRAGLIERGKLACGKSDRWMSLLARRVLAAHGEGPAGLEWAALTRFIHDDEGFTEAWTRNHRERGVCQIFWVPSSFAPRAGPPASWGLPRLATPAALAEWLGLSLGELDWFADCRGQEARLPAGPLRHYTYQWRAGRLGKRRLLEMPKPRMKAIQRRLLHELLEHIPVHPAVHGYCRDRSVATYTAPHAGQAIVVRFDLCDFFASVRSSRVHALFRTAGYPVEVARLLAGVCTNVVPPDVLRAGPSAVAKPMPWNREQLYRWPHLPQGAPTSPALANRCAYRLDCRLAGLARVVGARYTRYADDLGFSGDERLERCARRFQVQVCRIVLEEGFEVQTRKTRFMRQGVRQQLVGVVLNAHPNFRRDEYDRLKAILHNCVHHGAASQNRDNRPDFRAHLLGRIAYVALLNPTRGERLRRSFDRIVWKPND